MTSVWLAPGSEAMFTDCGEVLEFLDTRIPENGSICLKLTNTHYFGKMGTDWPLADIEFSEQSALKAMRNPGNDPDNELSRELSDHLDGLTDGDDIRILLDGESENGVKMEYCTIWTGMFLLNILLLAGEARVVKKFARELVARDTDRCER